MIRTLRAVLAVLALVAGHAQAQLAIEITGGGGNQIPVAIASFAGESQLQPAISDVIENDLARSGRLPHPLHRGAESAALGSLVAEPRCVAQPQRRCARDRRRVPGGGRALRGALPALRRAQAGRSLAESATPSRAAQAARDRAPDRRLHLREAHRRQGRLQHADRLRGEARHAVPSSGRRRRRRERAGDPDLQRADHVAGVVAGRHAARVRVVSAEEADRVRAEPDDAATAAAGGELPRLEQRAGVVARRPAPRRGAVARRRHADLFLVGADGGERAAAHGARAASIPSRCFRPTGSGSTSPPTAAAVRRSIACRPRAATRSGSPSAATYNVSPRCEPRRQDARLRRAERRPLPGRRHGSRDTPGRKC